LAVTRHARRIYAGGIPPRATEEEVHVFFNDIVSRALYPKQIEGRPVMKIYLNSDKAYAFVEFPTIELTTACMQLDNIRFDHYTGSSIIRVKRPMDYRPELLTSEQLSAPIPYLNLDALGDVGASSSSGPGKIFIGGLPYNLTDDQIKEVLLPFGPIRAFHQVRDPGSITSKGYAFCEFMNPESAEVAIAGLNGLKLGEKTLNVRIAQQATNVVPGTNPLMSMGMTGLSSIAPNLGIPSNGYGQGINSSTPPTRVRAIYEYKCKNSLLFCCYRF